jgi:hypothetical protein
MTRLIVRVLGALACLTWTSAVIGVASTGNPHRRCSVCDEGEEH